MANQSIYQKELENLEQAKNFLRRPEYSKMDIQLEYKKLVENYEELVDQVKIITKISDRLQGKLNTTNEKLEFLNAELNDKNIQLKEAITAVTEAKIGRRASTIVLFVAILLFIATSAILEPQIDNLVTYFFGTSKPLISPFWIGITLKCLLALLIKPGEKLLEDSMLKKEQAKHLKNIEMK
ncbi:MAG: hypothetical protein AUJ98_02790 [Bacteroidetes bacterium CG2_30_33_31]|nr:MAG: hypothetical protein AUJ98_02790 [Bacteroidetes bacterium CG2_30_33_31]